MLNQIARECFETSRSKGFYCPTDLHTVVAEGVMLTPGQLQSRDGFDPGKAVETEKVRFTNADLMLGKLMLVVSEMGEYLAAETKENAVEELADASIRIFHICGAMDLNLNMLWEQAYGMWPPYRTKHGVMEQFLIHISEAAEACRHQNVGDFSLRLAAAFNAIGQMASDRGFDLKAAVDKKMEVNRNRPFLHGKKSAT